MMSALRFLECWPTRHTAILSGIFWGYAEDIIGAESGATKYDNELQHNLVTHCCINQIEY